MFPSNLMQTGSEFHRVSVYNRGNEHFSGANDEWNGIDTDASIPELDGSLYSFWMLDSSIARC